MLIYDQQRTTIANLTSIKFIEVYVDNSNDIYKICCDYKGELFSLGNYKSVMDVAIVMNEILAAYEKNKRVFYMPIDLEDEKC